MKRIFRFLVLIAAFCVAHPAYAADTNDLATEVVIKGDFVQYTVTLVHTGAATDNVYSQVIDLAGLLLEGATIQFVADTAGSRDVDLFIQGSNVLRDSTFESYFTRTEWNDYSTNRLGLEETFLLHRALNRATPLATFTAGTHSAGISTVHAVADTSSDSDVVYSEVDMAMLCRYIRVLSDGQTGNPVAASTLVILTFRKNQNVYRPFYRAVDVD